MDGFVLRFVGIRVQANVWKQNQRGFFFSAQSKPSFVWGWFLCIDCNGPLESTTNQNCCSCTHFSIFIGTKNVHACDLALRIDSQILRIDHTHVYVALLVWHSSYNTRSNEIYAIICSFHQKLENERMRKMETNANTANLLKRVQTCNCFIGTVIFFPVGPTQNSNYSLKSRQMKCNVLSSTRRIIVKIDVRIVFIAWSVLPFWDIFFSFVLKTHDTTATEQHEWKLKRLLHDKSK